MVMVNDFIKYYIWKGSSCDVVVIFEYEAAVNEYVNSVAKEKIGAFCQKTA